MTIGDSFVTIDFHVTRFPFDENIIRAATDVVFQVLRAVEQAIAFYISSQSMSYIPFSIVFEHLRTRDWD